MENENKVSALISDMIEKFGVLDEAVQKLVSAVDRLVWRVDKLSSAIDKFKPSLSETGRINERINEAERRLLNNTTNLPSRWQLFLKK